MIKAILACTGGYNFNMASTKSSNGENFIVIAIT